MEEKKKTTRKKEIANNKTKKRVTTTKKAKSIKKEKKETKDISHEEIINSQAQDVVINAKEEVSNENVVAKDKLEEVQNHVSTKEKKESNNEFSLLEVIGLLIAAAVITFIIGIIVGNNYAKDHSYSSDPTVNEIRNNYNIIKEQYPDVSNADLLNGAIEGMLDAVGDPNASLIEKDSTMDIEIKGIYEGIGLEVTTYGYGEIYVSSVFTDSSAEQVGIKVGDQLIQIDDLVLNEKTGSDFAEYIRNSDKDQFSLVIARDGEEISYSVEKQLTIIPSVFTEVFENGDKKTGYLQIAIFSEQTLTQFQEKLIQLENENIDNLIIDLRGNSGGVLTIVNGMLSLMMDSSNILYQTDTNGEIEKYYSSGDSNKEYDIVVLVDGESASASEIMASALRDNLGASIVGTKTYGKGTVQQIKELSSGDEYKVTTKKWLTPKGVCVDKVGLEPDYVVELDEEYYKDPSDVTDNQLQKALELLK